MIIDNGLCTEERRMNRFMLFGEKNENNFVCIRKPFPTVNCNLSHFRDKNGVVPVNESTHSVASVGIVVSCGMVGDLCPEMLGRTRGEQPVRSVDTGTNGQ